MRILATLMVLAESLVNTVGAATAATLKSAMQGTFTTHETENDNWGYDKSGVTTFGYDHDTWQNNDTAKITVTRRGVRSLRR